MLPPLPRCSGWAYSSLLLTQPCQPSPKPLSGRPAHWHFRGLLSVHSRCGLHTRTVTKIVTVIRRLQTFRHLHACSGCFRLERSPGGVCTRWKCAALSRRTWLAAAHLADVAFFSQRMRSRKPSLDVDEKSCWVQGFAGWIRPAACALLGYGERIKRHPHPSPEWTGQERKPLTHPPER